MDNTTVKDLVKLLSNAVLNDKPKPNRKSTRRSRKRSSARRSNQSSRRSSVVSQQSNGTQFNELRDNSAVICIGPNKDASKLLRFRKSLRKGTTHWYTFKTPFVQRCFAYHYRLIKDTPVQPKPIRYIDAVTIDFQSSTIPSDWYSLPDATTFGATLRSILTQAIESYFQHATDAAASSAPFVNIDTKHDD